MPSSQVTYTAGQDIWGVVRSIAGQAPLPVEVRGDPFGEGPERMRAAVLRAAAGATSEPWLRFVSADAASEYRVIWVFDAAGIARPDDVCEGRVGTRSAGGARDLGAEAVLCHRGRALCAVRGRMVRPPSSGDRRFAQLVAQMTRQVLRGRT